VAEHGPHELVQGGEGQLGLGLRAAAGEDLQVSRAAAGFLEQRRLADAGLPAQQEDLAARRAARAQEEGDAVELGSAAVEGGRGGRVA
jgi:hypothetical protein